MEQQQKVAEDVAMESPLPRRKFLTYLGLSASIITVGVACQKDAITETASNSAASNAMVKDCIDLGKGDIGILNYAYALEQLEAAFYTKVAEHFYSDMRPKERELLTDIRNHEIAHREFLKLALGDNAIPELMVDFSGINFNNRASVLGTAKAFEDLGVSAYNGAGNLITNRRYLTIAGKIVSVEARHAAYIREITDPGSFADMSVIDANGLERSMTPKQVLAIAGSFIKNKICADNLPTA